jgi:hypothetical protein
MALALAVSHAGGVAPARRQAHQGDGNRRRNRRAEIDQLDQGRERAALSCRSDTSWAEIRTVGLPNV